VNANTSGDEDDDSIRVGDVKQFIKELKKRINHNAFGELIGQNNRIINELAGEGLI
jgi:hypothetical protein